MSLAAPPPTRPTAPRVGIALLALTLVAACAQKVVFETNARDDGGTMTGMGGAGGNGGGPGGGPGVCPGGQSPVLRFSPNIADAIVAVDRSMSMNGPFGSSTKLLAARNALAKAVMEYQGAVHVGYVGFPDPLGCQQGVNCCAIDVGTWPGLLPIQNAYPLLVRAMSECDAPSFGCVASYKRPIGAALAGCREVFDTFDQFVPNRYVLLVTDGQPDEEPGCGGSTSDPCSEAQEEAAKLGNNFNVQINVVGLMTPSQDRCLGGLAATTRGDYRSVTPSDLESRTAGLLRDIARDACTLEVYSRPMDLDRVTLQLNNADVPRDDPDGWEFANGDWFRIFLRGAACEAAIHGDPSKDIELREDCRRP